MSAPDHIISYDLGTGGLKTSLYTAEGKLLAFRFVSYETYYPKPDYHEQAPEDWWQAIVRSTRDLLAQTSVDPQSIRALALSGHSLGVVPIGHDGSLLRERTPIWSDKRAVTQAKDFFSRVSYEDWYMATGNGFPAECYSLFKVLWYKEDEPELYARIHKVIGTKDYCNYKFTGCLATDYSYASGSGVFDLKAWGYRRDFIEAAGISPDILPELMDSHAVLGTVSAEAARETGLSKKTLVICGGVDNSCMALGAKGTRKGRIYTSLGSSAWIALVSDVPVLEFRYKPYVFAHVIPGMYASATCIFSAGSSLRWVRDTLCSDLLADEAQGGTPAYVAMDALAADSPPGARDLFFNPSLSGGSMIEDSPSICGGFAGIRLDHTRGDLIRSSMEGIALNLRVALDILATHCPDIKDMLIVGGGSKSPLWRQIFANIYDLPILKSSVDQDAAALGAAALATRGAGLQDDYDYLDTLHSLESNTLPQAEAVALYTARLPLFKQLASSLSDLGEHLRK